jgi:hypothetical protein
MLCRSPQGWTVASRPSTWRSRVCWCGWHGAQRRARRISKLSEHSGSIVMSSPKFSGSAAPALVLDILKTSDTQPFAFEVDQIAARLKRMRRSITVASQLIGFQLLGEKYAPHMITLTYKPGIEWRPYHVTEFIKRVRQYASRRAVDVLPFVWVAELQKRGAVHYHVIFWLPTRLSMPKPDKQGWWPHGFTNSARARNAIGYLIKYSTKGNGEQRFPKGLRLSGNGGIDKSGRTIRRWSNLPTWLRELGGVNARYVRKVGLGMVEVATGLQMQTPFRVSYCSGVVIVQKLFEHPNRLEHWGWYSSFPRTS